MTGSSRSLAGNLVLALLSTALVLGPAEIGLRLFRPVQYLKPPDPEKARQAQESLYRPSRIEGLTYEMAPNRNGIFEGMHVRTNASGLRGPSPSQDGPDLIRLAVLGDSFTFGFGVDEQDTYPSLIQETMNDAAVSNGRRFEVLNFGVVGYSTRDEAIVLKQKAIPFHPQGVIIGYLLNDPETDPRPSLHKFFDPPVWWRHSHLLRLCHLGWNCIQVWIDGGGDYQRYLHARGGRKWRSVCEAFRDTGTPPGRKEPGHCWSSSPSHPSNPGRITPTASCMPRSPRKREATDFRWWISWKPSAAIHRGISSCPQRMITPMLWLTTSLRKLPRRPCWLIFGPEWDSIAAAPAPFALHQAPRAAPRPPGGERLTVLSGLEKADAATIGAAWG